MHHPGTNNKVYNKVNDNFEWSSENFKKISEIIKNIPRTVFKVQLYLYLI